jgi:hypothetical protein
MSVATQVVIAPMPVHPARSWRSGIRTRHHIPTLSPWYDRRSPLERQLTVIEWRSVLRQKRSRAQTVPGQAILRRRHGKRRMQEQGQGQRCLLSNRSPGERGHVDSDQHRRLGTAGGAGPKLLGRDCRTVGSVPSDRSHPG